MKKLKPEPHDNPVWKTYIRKPDPIRAKVFRKGDEDGFVDLNGEVPFIKLHDGGRQLGAFEENYLTVDENGLRHLVNKQFFDKQHDCIDG